MKIADAITQIQKFTTELVNEQARTRGELERALQERENQFLLPLPKSDHKEMVAELLEEAGNTWPKTLSHKLKGLIDQPMKQHNIARINLLGGLGGAPGLFGMTSADAPQTGILPEALLFIFRDQIRDGVLRAIDQMPWPEKVGPPRAKRVARVAELDEKITELQSRLDSIREASRLSQATDGPQEDPRLAAKRLKRLRMGTIAPEREEM